MSEEVVTTTTEAVNGNPETSTVEEKECNGTNDETKTEDESVIPETSTVDENECNGTKDDEIVGSPSRGSKFVASFKLKAKNAKEAKNGCFLGAPSSGVYDLSAMYPRNCPNRIYNFHGSQNHP